MSFNYFNQGIFRIICDLNMSKVFLGTIIFPYQMSIGKFTDKDIILALENIQPKLTFMVQKQMFQIWDIMDSVSIDLSIASNCIILFDLYLLLKNPFYPRARRNRVYHGINWVIAISTILIVYFDKNEDALAHVYITDNSMGIFLCVLSILTIFPTFAVFRRIL